MEIMITIAIIGIVAAIAIPAVTQFGEDAKEKVCRQNLKTIDSSKVQWAIDNDKSDDAEPTEEDLAEYIKGDFPQAIVAGALYRIGNIVTPALCSYHGNGFIEGFGMTVPESLANLVATGQLSASDVISAGWQWVATGPGKGQFWVMDDSFKTVVTEEVIDSTPEVTVNGETIKSDMIYHFSKEYMESKKEYYESRKGEAPNIDWLCKMDKGGYLVFTLDGNDYITEWRDHRGTLLGYKVEDLSDHSYTYYDASPSN